jgi:exonuclease III
MGPYNKSTNTASKLSDKCFELSTGDKKKHNNICMRNVMDVFTKKEYDIIHTQETKNWLDLYEYLKSKNPNYRYICLESNSQIYITTFYNKTKLELLGAKYCDLSNGRSVILAKFKDLNTNIDFISINIHARHKPIDVTIINNTEKYFMDTSIDNNGNLFKNNLKKNKFFKQHTKASFIGLPIILGGDTNDHKKYNYWKGIKLFNTLLKCNNKPPATCCSTSNKKNYFGYGDYFIYSDDFIEVKPNTMIPAKYPSSDHAPVDIELQFKLLSSISSNTNTTNHPLNKSKLNSIKSKLNSSKSKPLSIHSDSISSISLHPNKITPNNKLNIHFNPNNKSLYLHSKRILFINI